MARQVPHRAWTLERPHRAKIRTSSFPRSYCVIVENERENERAVFVFQTNVLVLSFQSFCCLLFFVAFLPFFLSSFLPSFLPSFLAFFLSLDVQPSFLPSSFFFSLSLSLSPQKFLAQHHEKMSAADFANASTRPTTSRSPSSHTVASSTSPSTTKGICAALLSPCARRSIAAYLVGKKIETHVHAKPTGDEGSTYWSHEAHAASFGLDPNFWSWPSGSGVESILTVAANASFQLASFEDDPVRREFYQVFCAPPSLFPH